GVGRPGAVALPQFAQAGGASVGFQEDVEKNAQTSWRSVLPALRPAVDLRDSVECGRSRGRMGHTAAPAERRESFQEVLADETPDEEGGTGTSQPASGGVGVGEGF